MVDYLTDISVVAIAPSNPLYNLYQYGIGYELHLYLEAMDRSKGIPVELIVALDEKAPDAVLGFLLYLPVEGDPEVCAVPYMAVPKVPCFEALGFQVLGARGPQVVNTRDHGTDGLLAVLDVAPIYRSLEVKQIHTYLLQQQGKRAIVEAEKKHDHQLDQMTRQAAFVRERLGV